MIEWNERTPDDDPHVRALRERLHALSHAMQSGVAMRMQFDARDVEPKHLRVGVNSALVQVGAVVQLLVDRGLVTWADALQSMVDAMQREVDLYERELSARTGAHVTLA